MLLRRVVCAVLLIGSLVLGPGGAQATGSGIAWNEIAASGPPGPLAYAALADDPASGQTLLFSGRHGSTWSNGLWTWTGTAWDPIATAGGPSPRDGGQLVYDPRNRTMVTFGGLAANGQLNDTWTWDGHAWSQRSPATAPPARVDYAAAYDAATSQLVMFGGFGGHAWLGDTWTWDGATWTQLNPAHSPAPRSRAVLAYDSATRQLVLFGGSTASGYFDDTWTWTGTDWSQLAPAAAPSGRFGAAMTFDPDLGQLVLFGGDNNGGSTLLNDTWAWNGATWTQLGPALSPPARSASAMAYDAATRQLLVFGGLTSFADVNAGTDSALGDTWAISSPTITLGPAAIAEGTVSKPYHQQLTATGGQGPYAFAISAGALPSGIDLSPGGLLAGTPTTAGSSRVTISATDASGFIGSASYVVVVGPGVLPPALTTTSASSALGKTKVPSRFSTATKILHVGSASTFVTIRVKVNPTLVGQHVTILVAHKSSSGRWSGYTAIGSPVIEADGYAYSYVSAHSAQWNAYRASFAGNASWARSLSGVVQVRWL